MYPLSGEDRRRLFIRILLRAILLLLFGLFIYILPRIFSWVAPFAIAFVVSYLLRPFIGKLHEKTGIPWKILSLIGVIIVYAILFSLVGVFIYTVVSQAVSLAQNIQPVGEYLNTAATVVSDQLDWLLDYLPPDIEGLLTAAIESLLEFLQNVSSDFINFVFSKTVSFTSAFGRILLDLVICIMATYFIMAEYNEMGAFFRSRVKGGIYDHFVTAGAAVKSALSGYLKAQFMLASVAFIVMFIALGLYGQDYSLLIALLLGVIDFLPLLGTAVVLIPWGLIHLIAGETGKGIFLILLSAGFFLFRKFIEPKIVGSQTGLHPLVALLSIYLGMSVAGVWGAIAGPIVLLIAINLFQSPIFDGVKRDFKALGKHLSALMQ